MKLAVDVDYRGDRAHVAGVLFTNWNDEMPVKVIHAIIDKVEPYEAGSFYKREMPCILSLIDKFELELDFLVIDGFVTLGKEGIAGLGYHVWNAVNGRFPVIGMAKNRYKDHDEKTEVYRGESAKPVMVTSIGVSIDEAKDNIKGMHGMYRIPTLLKLADSECRALAKT